MATPGQARRYNAGQLEIRELRATEEEALGDEYEWRQAEIGMLRRPS